MEGNMKATITMMRIGHVMRVFILVTFIISLLLVSVASFSPANAETKTFIREYEYQASEMDSKISSRVIAFQEVKRLLLEEIGTYLQSQTEVINLQLTKDHIIVLTGGVVQTELISENWDGKKYWMKAMIKLDPSSVAREIEILRNEKSRELEITNINKNISNDLQELKRLKSDALKGKLSEKKNQEYAKKVKQLRVKELYESGYNLLENRHYSKALEELTKCIAEDSQNEEAYIQRGKAYAALGQHEKAIADYSKSISLNSKSVKAYALRGGSYLKIAMRKKAFDDFNKAIELNPKDAESLSLRGSAYVEVDNLVQAKDDIEEAILLDPKLWRSYLTLAKINGKMEDPNLAVDNLNKVIQLNPHAKEAYLWRGVAFEERLQDSQAAKKDYNTVINMEQEGVESLIANAIAFFKLGRLDEGINNITQYISIVPRDSKGYSARGRMYLIAKDMQRAKQDFDHAIELDPKLADPYLMRGTVYVLQGNLSMAISEFKQAISIEPKNAKAYMMRGRVHFEMKNYDQAIQDLNHAIELNPKLAESYDHRGASYFSQHNNDLGCLDAQKACALGKCRLLEMAKGRGLCR
jgi:tetratricopeptide (TPR) repeat protein